MALIVAALGYLLLPEEAIPRDRFGLLGFIDNDVTLAPTLFRRSLSGTKMRMW